MNPRYIIFNKDRKILLFLLWRMTLIIRVKETSLDQVHISAHFIAWRCLTCWYNWDTGQAWLYCGVLFIPVIFVFFISKERSGTTWAPHEEWRGKRRKAKDHNKNSIYSFFIGFIIRVLIIRYHWSNVPVALVIAANAIVLVRLYFRFLSSPGNSMLPG